MRTIAPLALLTLASCAEGPLAVSKKGDQDIQRISQFRLCDAAAVWRNDGKRFDVIEREISRRGISCQAHIDITSDNCQNLRVKRWTDDGNFAFTVVVENMGSRFENFRMQYRGDVTKQLSIESQTERSFSLVPSFPQLNRLKDKRDTSAPAFNECKGTLSDIEKLYNR